MTVVFNREMLKDVFYDRTSRYVTNLFIYLLSLIEKNKKK